MFALVRPFIDICLLRLRPQDLPASPVLLWLTLAAHTVTGVLASTQFFVFGKALLAGIAGTALLSLLPVTALWLKGRAERIPQTLAALAGSLALLDLVALPLTAWSQTAQAGGGVNPLAGIALLALLAWNLGVVGHVMRHALDIAYFLGVVIALAFYLVFIDLMDAMFQFSR